uniref:Uncharacterized protein n=1 Tax=Panagrolaimus sp. PS1159 TaxID=55785 RepID=A0AC35F8U7_9BILA
MEDLARFLIMCADGVVRRQAEEFAVQYYFDCLVKEFGNSKKMPYSMEQLQKAYNYAFFIEAIKKNGLGVIPFFLGNINDKTEENVKNAFRDFGTLKVLHLYEDLDKLLCGELKDIFDQFGLIKL